MLNRTIENEYLKVTVADKGAELISIWDKEKEREVLWQADPAYWVRRAPILFPNVGRHHENICRLDGKTYATSQHGFARDGAFTCEEIKQTSVTHKLVDDEGTREYFPFAFVLKVSHILEGRTLRVCWHVENTNDKTMYFTIGGHPGFNVPILPDTKQTDYKLLFKQEKEVFYRLVHGTTGTADAEPVYTLELENGSCPITEHMFDKDALIFDDGQIEWTGIAYPDGTPYITMTCTGFTNFGIWTMPGAPYICLEPWMGRCDDYGFTGDISEKKDVITLEAEKIFEKEYEITVH